MQNNRLAVSETFYSIQGEGQTMGIPAVFLRLGGCNLLCQSTSWVCDTIEVWRKSKSIEFQDVLSKEYTDKILNGAHLVITGGEPLMHLTHIENYITWFINYYDYKPIIEIETNGTISPSLLLKKYVSYWNVSPKLSSAGEQNKKELRLNEKVLTHFSLLGYKTIFKFVISSDEDISEAIEDFFPYMDKNQIVLMPAGSNQDELNKTRLNVAEKCRMLNLRYSERLHVVIWNQKTGV